MTYSRQALQNIIDFCDQKWAEADKAAGTTIPQPDHVIAEKKAYAAV